MLKYIIIVIIVLSSTLAHADKFFGIYPRATMSYVKSVYPNASILEEKPAWLLPYERFITLSGNGIDGTIALVLINDIESSKKFIKPYLEREESGEQLGFVDSEWKNHYKNSIDRYSINPELDPWYVEQIRWSPSKQIKLQTFIKKYGKPNGEDIDDNMYKYKVWNKLYNIKAKVSDSNMIDLVIYGEVFGDYICAPLWEKGQMCNPRDYKPVSIKRAKPNK